MSDDSTTECLLFPGIFVTVQVPTCLVLDKSGPISKAMVDECENWATNCRHRWPC